MAAASDRYFGKRMPAPRQEITPATTPAAGTATESSTSSPSREQTVESKSKTSVSVAQNKN
jgi:hypothetical protein